MRRLRLRDSEKGFIIENYSKMTFGKLADELKRPKSTIQTFYNRYRKTHRISNLKPQGRKPLLFSRKSQKKILSFFRKNRHTTLKIAIIHLNLPISPPTLSKFLKSNSIKSYKELTKVKLTPAHISMRLKFAKKYKSWSSRKWGLCLFSDESSLIIGKKYQRRVWRAKGEALRNKCFRKLNTNYQPKYLKVWACLSKSGVSDLYFLQQGRRSWNSKVYSSLLEQNLLKIGKTLIGNKFIFQQVIYNFFNLL